MVAHKSFCRIGGQSEVFALFLVVCSDNTWTRTCVRMAEDRHMLLDTGHVAQDLVPSISFLPSARILETSQGQSSDKKRALDPGQDSSPGWLQHGRKVARYRGAFPYMVHMLHHRVVNRHDHNQLMILGRAHDKRLLDAGSCYGIC
jgi:hypothetical protein